MPDGCCMVSQQRLAMFAKRREIMSSFVVDRSCQYIGFFEIERCFYVRLADIGPLWENSRQCVQSFSPKPRPRRAFSLSRNRYEARWECVSIFGNCAWFVCRNSLSLSFCVVVDPWFRLSRASNLVALKVILRLLTCLSWVFDFALDRCC